MELNRVRTTTRVSRMAGAGGTALAIAPAGQTSNQQPSTLQQAFAAATAAINATSSVINNTVTANATRDAANARAQADVAIAQINAALQQTNSAQERQALMDMLNRVTAAQQQLPPPDHTALYVGLGVAGLAVLGGIAYFAMRPKHARRNPSRGRRRGRRHGRRHRR